MAERPQHDIDAEAFEMHQFAEMKKKGGAAADLVDAVLAARKGRTEAGLDCTYTEDGEARFTVQQGLKAACHAREDVATTLILQVKILQRLDAQDKFDKFVFCVLVFLLIKIFW